MRFFAKYIRIISKHQFFFAGVSFFVAIGVFALLFYANFGFLNITGYFEKHDVYQDSIILFFHNECPYCAKVDEYLINNHVEEKLKFVRLNVFQSDYNLDELQDKAQICGLEIDKLGVPFMWDGLNKRCIIGYVDIINFFRQNMANGAK